MVRQIMCSRSSPSPTPPVGAARTQRSDEIFVQLLRLRSPRGSRAAV